MKSSVPAFRKALVERLAANTSILADAAENGGDLEVILGNPQPETAPKTIIMVGEMSNHSYEFTCGLHQANETYDIDLLVSLIDYMANDKQTLIDRAYGLGDMIIADVLDWNEGSSVLDASGNEVASAVIPDFVEDQEFTGDDAREFAVTMRLRVIARVA